MGLDGAQVSSNFLKRTWLFGLLIGVLLLLFGLKLSSVHAQNISISSTRNCDANAVIWCGEGSVDQLMSEYNNGDGHNSASSIHNIYSFFGISSADINNMTSSSVDVQSGSVSSSGDVFGTGGKLVATHALTGGRQDISGSTREDVGGTVFFVRPPSVSFASSPLAAFVVMKDGRFDFAVLASCGNAVKATPTTPSPAPKPAPTPTTPTPAPTPTPTPSVNVCNGNTTNTSTSSSTGNVAQGTTQSGNCSTNSTTVMQQTQTTPTPTPAPTTTASGQCTSLTVSVDKNDPMTVSATANAQEMGGATIQNVLFNFGDGTSVGPDIQTTQSHTFQSSGTFTITAFVNFNNSSSTLQIPQSVCQASVNISSPPATTTPTVPQTPAAPSSTTTPTQAAPASNTLVNTGPGDIVGLFGITTITSTLGYRWFLRRKLSF